MLSNLRNNVEIVVRCLRIQVNMPLLRLLHQISNMYQNVKDTQSELKEQEPQELKIPSPKPPPPPPPPGFLEFSYISYF